MAPRCRRHAAGHAGKDALVYLVRHFAENAGDLPEDVEPWVMPMVNPGGGATALRAALLLEPTLLYGLYQFDEFRALVGDDGLLPVPRVMAPQSPRR